MKPLEQHCHRFLWRNLKTDVHVMTRVNRDLKIPGRDILGRGIMAEETWGEFTVARRQN